MNIRSIATGSAAVALSLALVAPVAAISVDVSGATDVSVGASGQASSSSGSTGAGTSGSVSSDTEATTDADTSTNLDGAVSSNAATNADAGIVLFTRADITSAVKASSNGAGNAAVNLNFAGSPTSVQTTADLSAYVATQMKNDEQLAEVEASSDSIEVTYKESAKFLGFIPASLSATAVVDASGEVTVTRPWYRFLYSSVDSADLETKIQSRVNAALQSDTVVGGNANASASAEARFTAAEQAKLVAEIRAAMEEEFHAAANTDVSASGSAHAN